MKTRKNNGIFYVVISLIAVLGIGSALYAYSVTQNIHVQGDYVYNEAEGQFTEDITLGAFPGGDIYSEMTLYDKFNLGDDKNKTEHFYEVIDFTTATYTQAIFDPNGGFPQYNDFYLVDLWIENTSKATSSVRLGVTTSTATVIASDDATILSEDAGASTLMDGLGNAFGADGAAQDGATATSSMFYLRQYPGSDTRLAAGTNEFPFLINSTTNIMVYATTSSAGPVYFSGKLHIIGRESDR